MGTKDHTDPGPREMLPGKHSHETLAPLPMDPSWPQEQTGAKVDWEGNPGGAPRLRVLEAQSVTQVAWFSAQVPRLRAPEISI